MTPKAKTDEPDEKVEDAPAPAPDESAPEPEPDESTPEGKTEQQPLDPLIERGVTPRQAVLTVDPALSYDDSLKG